MRSMQTALIVSALLAASAAALEKGGLVLRFEENFESGLGNWEMLDPESWRIEEDAETGNGVLSLFRGGGVARTFFAPRSVAMIRGLEVGDFILEARMRHRGKQYAHQDLCVVFNAMSDYQFYYAHFAPVADDGANTIFLVDNADRQSIATDRNDGITWGEAWHDVRIVRDVTIGTIAVYFDDMDTPVMVAEDRRFAQGGIGLGSFNDTGCFDDVRIWTRPDASARTGQTPLIDDSNRAGLAVPE